MTAPAPVRGVRQRWIDVFRVMGAAQYARAVRARLEQAIALAVDVHKRIAARRTRVSADRCAYRRPRRTSSGRWVYSAACGGRMRPINKARTVWACRTCGRDQRRLGAA